MEVVRAAKPPAHCNSQFLSLVQGRVVRVVRESRANPCGGTQCRLVASGKVTEKTVSSPN